MSVENAIRMVLDRLELEKDYTVSLTQDLVRIPTVNPKFETNPAINQETRLQNHVNGVLRGMGMTTEQFEIFQDRPNVRGTLAGSAERSLVLNGHIDVVPVGDLKQWTVEPFGAELKQGRLYGRGAVDMKAGVGAMIAAVRAIRESGIELQGRLEVHTVVDEEAGGLLGSMEMVKRGFLASAVIVTEPTWGAVMPAEGGLEWCRVTIRGRNAHSAFRYNEIYPQHDTPDRLEPGVNAIEIAAEFIQAIRRFEHDITRRRTHPLLPPGMNTINIGVIRGGSGLGEDGLPTVMSNPAIIPDVVVIDLDMKFLPQETSAEYRKEFEAFVHHFCQQSLWLQQNPIQLLWELGGLHFPPMNTPIDHLLVKTVVKQGAVMGREIPVQGFVAVTDAAFYAGKGVPSILFGPSGAGFHGADEYVDVQSIIDTSKVVAASVLEWCGVR